MFGGIIRNTFVCKPENGLSLYGKRSFMTSCRLFTQTNHNPFLPQLPNKLNG